MIYNFISPNGEDCPSSRLLLLPWNLNDGQARKRYKLKIK